MTAERKITKKNLQVQLCPYLGLRDDVATHMAFTSPLNHCHRGRIPAPVVLGHQGSYCLDVNHVNCPVFIDGAGKPFPRELRGRAVKSSEYTYPVIRKRSWRPWVFVLALFILLGMGYWLLEENGFLIAASTPTSFQLPLDSKTPVPASLVPSPSLPSVLTFSPEIPDPSDTATVTPFPTLTPTLDQTVTFSVTSQANTIPIFQTPTQVSLHSLEMPIGPVQKYLIHQVSVGENLTGLATKYQTSVDAIMMVNIALKVPIRDGSVVIMPLDMSNPNGLPALEPYQVENDQIIVEALAAELKTDPGLLKYFNLYVDGEKLRKGDWILVPRVRPEAP